MSNDLVSYTPPTIRLPQDHEWAMMERYASAAVKSGLVTGNVNPAQAFFIILKGYELNITPIQALSDIHLINGKPGLSVQLMISLANRSKMLSHFDIPDAFEAFNSGRATVTACRHDRPDSPISMTFTKDDAERAGLLKRSGGVWNAYMGQMLVNRAVSMVLRRIIPEALSGMYLSEELQDETTNPRPSITVESVHRESLPALKEDIIYRNDTARFAGVLSWAESTFKMTEGDVMDALYAIEQSRFIAADAKEVKYAIELWATKNMHDITEDEFSPPNGS